MAGLDKTSSALLIIDAQQEYGADGALPLTGLDPALTAIADLQAAARGAEVPIVHVGHLGAAGSAFDPERGGRFLEPSGPQGNETVVMKTMPNAFAGTNLAELLQGDGIDTVVVVGFMTHMCVSSTVRAALDLGLRSVVAADATATRDLPGADGGGVVSATALQTASLAGLADRFAAVTTTPTLIDGLFAPSPAAP